MVYTTADGKTFRTEQEARAYAKAAQIKAINKLLLNSHYGYLPGSVMQKLGNRRGWRRAADERASIWRRLFGDPKPKPKHYAPIPGGASLQFASSTTVRLYPKPTAEEVTKTGRQALAKLLEKSPGV